MRKLLDFTIDCDVFTLTCPDCKQEVYSVRENDLFSHSAEENMIRIRLEKSEDHFEYECNK